MKRCSRSVREGPIETQSKIDAIQKLEQVRLAQREWKRVPIKQRAKILGKVAARIVQRREVLAKSITAPMRTSYFETITAELLPLAETAKWLSQTMARVLRTRHTSVWKTPMWLGSLRSEVRREALGTVLIIGTWNYPIFLTGSQLLHALAAGNGVVIKPAPGCEAVSAELVDIVVASGVPRELVLVLDSRVEAAKLAIEVGVDHIVMTGSSTSGRKVLEQAASKLIPATMELSGCDAVFVLPDADLDRVADLLRFGLMLNGGATCIAPRRVFVPESLREALEGKLRERLLAPGCVDWKAPCSVSTIQMLDRVVSDAVAKGATFLSASMRSENSMHSENGGILTREREVGGSSPGSFASIAPVILTGVNTEMEIYRLDVFAPVMLIVPVASISQGVEWNRLCPYGLCVSIFGGEAQALAMESELNAGTVLINDFVVPTADPRLPFGGRGESGYGVTRGEEGLLAMSVPKVLTRRKGKWLPHSKLPQANDEQLLDGLLQLQHGEHLRDRFQGLRKVLRSVFRHDKKK